MKTRSSVMSIGLAFKSAMSGRHVVVLCKNAFEAKASAQKLYDQIGLHDVMLTHGTLLRFGGNGGSIEFGWIDCLSRRRLDDFDDAVNSITDAFGKASFP